ncbi:MAG TPA: hypothetical protein VK970_15450, partial [Candidatus Methylacidiphilales bacterium]|nr:hypothetical protein [Candidatus Methylacidiphilales bacterium]
MSAHETSSVTMDSAPADTSAQVAPDKPLQAVAEAVAESAPDYSSASGTAVPASLHPRTFLQKLDRWRAKLVDDVSFGFVNTMQWRHPLRADFRPRFEAYVTEWMGKTPEEYFSIPADYKMPTFPGKGRLSFPSPVPGEFDRNNVASFDLFPCTLGWAGAPTMILAHGLMSVSDYGYKLWARRLNESGWNAVFMHLPFHYSRRLPWQFHGELAVGGHLVRTAEGIRQAVTEVRVMLSLLKQAGSPLVGGWGTSYGGWIMGLSGCFDERLERLVLVEPILNVDAAIWQSPASVTLRYHLRRQGITRELTLPHQNMLCPSNYQPRLKSRHVLLIAGAYDLIAPPEDIWRLHKAWQGSNYACYEQGHVGYTLMPKSFAMAHELWPDDFKGSAAPA